MHVITRSTFSLFYINNNKNNNENQPVSHEDTNLA